jgi:hypothetical protein
MKKSSTGHWILLHILGKNTCPQNPGESLVLSHHIICSILYYKRSNLS